MQSTPLFKRGQKETFSSHWFISYLKTSQPQMHHCLWDCILYSKWIHPPFSASLSSCQDGTMTDSGSLIISFLASLENNLGDTIPKNRSRQILKSPVEIDSIATASSTPPSNWYAYFLTLRPTSHPDTLRWQHKLLFRPFFLVSLE